MLRHRTTAKAGRGLGGLRADERHRLRRSCACAGDAAWYPSCTLLSGLDDFIKALSPCRHIRRLIRSGCLAPHLRVVFEEDSGRPMAQ